MQNLTGMAASLTPALPFQSPLLPYIVALFLVVFLLNWYATSSKSSLSKLRGPPPQSFLLGNAKEYEDALVGEKDLEWMNKYGKTFRYKGGWGEDVLFTSDPKALQFVLQVSAYNFEKPSIELLRTKVMMGNNIVSCDGDEHKRHRKAMLPAFALPETRGLTPIFQSAARALMERWTEDVKQEGGRMVTNVHSWLAKAALDAIGEAAFGTKFGALDNQENRLSRNFNNLILKINGTPTPSKTIVINTLFAFPLSITRLIISIPSQALKKMKENRETTFEVGSELLKDKEGEVDSGLRKKDLLSLLVKSNGSDNPSSRLSDEEMLGEMSAVMFAGHETTATTTTFALWELAKQPHFQDKLRSEIRSFYAEAEARGEDCIPVTDFEKMPYTQAVLKETLRFNCLVPLQFRSASRDIIIPLSEPVIGKDGKEVREVPIRKGTRLLLSVVQYNRHVELWGEDAHSFNPERWTEKNLAEEAALKYGAFANLATFGAGVHACIGWRFAVYEIQSILIELINKFKFELTPEAREVRMAYARIAVPLLGEKREAKMPLVVSIAE